MCFSISDLIILSTISVRKFPTNDFFFFFDFFLAAAAAAPAVPAAAAAGDGGMVGIRLSNAWKELWLVWVGL